MGDEVSVRHEHWFSEWDHVTQAPDGSMQVERGIETKYYPPRIRRRKPEWADQVADPVIRQLFDELYEALSSDLLVLSAIGARTLFDRASFTLVGDCRGGFAGRLRPMLDEGYIGETEKDILEAMTDAGSASAHRGYAPDFEQLTTIVDILENFLQRTFVLRTAAIGIRRSTPPRPPRRRAESSEEGGAPA